MSVIETATSYPRLRPAARQEWLLKHLEAAKVPMSVLGYDFVNAYLVATNVAFIPMPFGAHRCLTLSRDLTAMFRKGLLHREVVGVPSGYSGMPNWVYAYEVAS